LHPNSSPLAEAERQLELQRQLIVALTPELYRQLALYLQVLRKGLLHSVQQACFHLATQTYPERFSAIGSSRRLELQQRLQALVQRCNCLLTVEQLMGLASQLQSRQQRQWRRDQQRLLLALAGGHGNGDGPGELEIEDGGQDGGQDGAQGPGDSRHNRFGQPRGSVQLGLDLPLSADLFGTGLEGLGSWLAGFATQGDLQQGDLGQDAVREDEIADDQISDDQINDDEITEDELTEDELTEALKEALGEQEDQEQEDQLEAIQQEQIQQQEAPQLEPLLPLAEGDPSGYLPPDPDQANPPAPEVQERDQGEPLPVPSPDGELGRAAALDLQGDPVDPSGPAGDPGDQPGLVPGENHSTASPMEPGQAQPASLHGEGPGTDLVGGPLRPGDRSALPQQDAASPPPPGPPANPGVGQPPRPEAASDAPRRPRRPPLRRGPGPSGGRPWSAAPDGPSDDVQFFQSLFAMAAEGLGRETPGLANPGSAGAGQGESGQGESGQGAADGSPDGLADSTVPAESPGGRDGGGQGAIRLDLLRQAGGLGPAPDPAGWQAQDSLMPQDAPSLLAWWEALDGALQRRLRNLSNAVNGELLRLGITRSPLPMALLDAVLKGQLDPQPAPANLVRLQMPFGGDSPESPGGDGPGAFPLGGPLDLVALLLRPTDLEFETPSLRVCRRRLEQNRSRLRTMAQRHRYWQRRVQALEAERQWFQDSPPTSREPA
jgi:hypothetical protein